MNMNTISPSDTISIRRERIGADGVVKPIATSAPPTPPRGKSQVKNAPSEQTNKKPDQQPLSKFEQNKMKVLAVLLGMFAIFLLLALVSYTAFDSPNASVSWRDLGGLLRGDESVRARADTTQNWLGLLGAILSHFCFNNTIGYAALMFPVLILWWSKHIYKETVDQKLVTRTAFYLLFGALFAAFAGTMQKISWMPSLTPEWSGAIGMFIADIFSKLASPLGSFLILTAATIVALILGHDFDVEKALLHLKLRYDRMLDRYFAWKKEFDKKAAEKAEEKARDKAVASASSGGVSQQYSSHSGEETEEPARVLRRQSEREGTASTMQDLLNKYSDEEDEIANQAEEIPQTKVSITPPPVIRRANAEQFAPKPAPPLTVKTMVKSEVTTPKEEVPATAIPEKIGIKVRQTSVFPPMPEMSDSSVNEEKIGIKAEENIPPVTLALTVQEREAEAKLKDRTFVEEVATDPRDEEIDYLPPTIDLLVPDDGVTDVDDAELAENARLLQEKLAMFKVSIENVTITPGPVVTSYEFTPAAGVKISQIENLSDDIALALKARGIRIIAPVPGRGTVAVEIPNANPSLVRFSSIIRSPKFKDAKFRLPIALGKTINGEVFFDDLAKMPHLLIAGSTGSGKSVGINSLICSLLYKMHPRSLKLMIIDPKKVEMTNYQGLRSHFLAVCPDIDEEIITTPANAVIGLKSVVIEMENRYDILAKVGQRNIVDYNAKVREGKYHNTTTLVHRELPYIVVIVDELADLMITAGKEVEEPITRLAQLARAVGIHLVVATQRPSVDVITGIIKANFPARIAYQVASKIDSRTILDGSGAEHLLGNGDMLYLPGGQPKPLRIQNSFLSTEEVEEICGHISAQEGYSQPFILPSVGTSKSGGKGGYDEAGGDRDDLFDEAARLIVRHQQGSVSLLQRRLKVGYARAARIVDQLEMAGIVGSFDGSKAREVLIESEAELEAYL